jgi:glyoxylase-like metal-dependent hydrolase (beta-lactamase superfamily II)
MFILDRRTFMAATSGALALSGYGANASKGISDAKVFTADAAGFLVDSTVILGEKKALLVDAQVNVPNAKRLADMITATGRELETIWITHHHPDHVLGLAVLMDRFPNAKALTHKSIRPLIEKSAAGTLAYLSGTAPGVFADRVVLPDAHQGDTLRLEGERIDVLGPLHGDTGLIAGLHIGSLNTVIAADIVYTGTHVWVEENTKAEDIAKWRKSLDLLESLEAKTIIPGHRNENSLSDISAVNHTRTYLDQWEKALATTKSAEELKAAMMVGNESLGLGYALERAVAAVYSK